MPGLYLASGMWNSGITEMPVGLKLPKAAVGQI